MQHGAHSPSSFHQTRLKGINMYQHPAYNCIVSKVKDQLSFLYIYVHVMKMFETLEKHVCSLFFSMGFWAGH